MKKIIYFLIVISSFLFVACGGQKENKEKSEIVVIAQGAKPKSLDPYIYNSIPDLAVSRQFYSTLLTKDENGNIIPSLAESYSFSGDTILDVYLKKGVKFHNGEELTAEDVVFSFKRMSEKPGSSVMVDEIEKVVAIDPYHVQFTLKRPFAPLLANLAHPLTSILNKKYVESKNDDISIDPMGTGPYSFVSWGDGEKIEMKANENYFDGAPKIKGIVFRAISEDSSRLAALETGEIDISYGVASINVQTIDENDKLYSISEPTTATEYIGTNVTKEPFNNKDFRLALSYAIDKQSIIDSILLGQGKVANSIVNPTVFGYYPDAKLYTYNVEKAKEALEKSGVKNKEFVMYVNDNPVRLQVAQIIQANLKEIGIDMTIETLEWGTYLQKTANGGFQAFLGGWISGTSDADLVLYPLLDSKSIGGAGNRARFSNPEFDRETEAGRTVLDPEKRKEHYKNAQIIAQEEVPLIVLYYKNANVGLNKRVKGFIYDPTTMHKLEKLEVVK